MKKKNKKILTIVGVVLFFIIVFGFVIYNFTQQSSLSSAIVLGDELGMKVTSGLFQTLISCSPSSGYNTCISSVYTYGAANSYINLQTSANNLGIFKGGYYVGPAKLKVKGTGDGTIIVYQGNNLGSSWDNVFNNLQCDQFGCSGNIQPISSTSTITLANPGEEYKGCPVFIGFSSRTASNGDWAWTSVGYGWVGTSNSCLDVKSVQCYDSSDCGSNQFCNKGGDWKTWSCEAKICSSGEEKCEGYDGYICLDNEWILQGRYDGKCGYSSDQPTTYYRLSNNQCSTVSILPSQKTNYDYTTLEICQSHITDIPTTNTYYRLYNNQCSPIQLSPSEVTSNDYSGFYECQAHIQSSNNNPSQESNNTPFYVLLGVIFVIVVLIIFKRKSKGRKK